MTIEIDGSTGEGGGQILRTSLALSMCTGQPIVLKNIRANRSKPGLMRQHLMCVTAAATISGARVEGAALNSQALSFTPGEVKAGDHEFNIGSAGSCTLVLQTIWPALLQSSGKSRIVLKGGTHNHMAPPFHFLNLSYAPLVRRLGAPVQLSLKRHGFYPAGGGEIHAEIDGAGESLAPYDLMERGAVREQYAECLIAAIPRSIAQRELRALQKRLNWQDDQLRVGDARQNEGPGNALMAILAHEQVCEVFTRIGAKGVTSEQVADSVAADVRKYLIGNAALGEHLADQWALPLALAVNRTGKAASYTCTYLSLHAHTNFGVIEKFLPVKFSSAAMESGFRVDVSPI